MNKNIQFVLYTVLCMLLNTQGSHAHTINDDAMLMMSQLKISCASVLFWNSETALQMFQNVFAFHIKFFYRLVPYFRGNYTGKVMSASHKTKTKSVVFTSPKYVLGGLWKFYKCPFIMVAWTFHRESAEKWVFFTMYQKFPLCFFTSFARVSATLFIQIDIQSLIYLFMHLNFLFAFQFKVGGLFTNIKDIAGRNLL